MTTYSRDELFSMRAQLEEQMNRIIDAYSDRYPGDMAAPPRGLADLKSKIADYYRELAKIDKFTKRTLDEAKETGWVYITLMDNDVKLFEGVGINTRSKWKVDRVGVVREFTSRRRLSGRVNLEIDGDPTAIGKFPGHLTRTCAVDTLAP